MSSSSNEKPLQIEGLWRIGEHTERQIAGTLRSRSQSGVLSVSLRSSVDVDRVKQEDLITLARWQRFRHRLSISNGGDLILIQSDVLLKECFDA